MTLRIRGVGLLLTVAAAPLGLSACNGAMPGNTQPGAIAKAAGRLAPLSGSIDNISHIIIIIQENRTVDNLFQGLPGAYTQSYGYLSSGKKIALRQVRLETKWDIDHSLAEFLLACNGTGSYPGTDCQMNGFNQEGVQCGTSGYPPCPIVHPQYAYVPPSETGPYFQMAQQYAFGDEMFASNVDGSSFVAHQYLIAGQASATVNFPDSNEWGCEGGQYDTIQTLNQQRHIRYGHRIPVCLDNQTLGDELDNAGISWRYYTASVPNGDGAYWNAYSAINHIYNGPDWKADVKSPQKLFFTDVTNGNLPAVSWITPTCENSDHAGCGANTGPAWVASIVNAIGQSQYWSSTAIFVTWDDPGGWYDHVPPKMLDYDGLGFRVPLLVISPYARAAYVSHTNYELASLIKFVEERYGLSALSVSDSRATAPTDCFNFAQRPRAFRVIPTGLPKDYFLHQAPDLRPVDTE